MYTRSGGVTSDEMCSTIYDKSTNMPRGACPRLFGNSRASFNHAWTRRSTTSFIPRRPLRPSTPLRSTRVVLKLTISLYLGFLIVFYVWKGAGRATVVLDGNSTRYVSLFNSTLISLFIADIGFLQDAETLPFPKIPDDLLLRCGTILWLCQRIVSAAIRRSYDRRRRRPPRSVSQALGHQFPAHPLSLSPLLPPSKPFFSFHLRVPLAPTLAQIRCHPPPDSCIGRTTALDSGPWMEIRPSPVSTLVLHVVPFPDNRRWKSPR